MMSVAVWMSIIVVSLGQCASVLSLSCSIDSSDELRNVIAAAGGKLVVIDFEATWCGPCKMIRPTIEAMSEEYEGKAVFVFVDVGECVEISTMEYDITSMPTFVFVKGGVELKDAKVVGANEAKIKQAIENNI